VVHPKLWPESKSPIGLDAKIEDRIDGLLKRMTVEEKVGQVVQPEWKSISPAEVLRRQKGEWKLVATESTRFNKPSNG